MATTLWVCLDCTLTREGDLDTTPDREPWGLLSDAERRELSLGLRYEDHDSECTEDDRENGSCECEQKTFSMADCQGCGSTLAGYRQAYTLGDVPPGVTSYSDLFNAAVDSGHLMIIKVP